MMKLFKKKKSDNKLSSTILQEQKSFEYSGTSTVNVSVPLKKPVPLLLPNISDAPAARSSTPPSIVMPKPRRLLTPTREILGRFDHDKTLVEDEPERPPPDMISPILLPTPHHEEEQFLNKAIAALPKSSSLHNIASISTVGSDESSRVYESALESLADDDNDRISLDLPPLTFLKKQTVDHYNHSETSSGTASPQRKQPRVAVQSTPSSATVTPTYSNAGRKPDHSHNNNEIPHQSRNLEPVSRPFDQDETIKHHGQNNRQVQRLRPEPEKKLDQENEEDNKQNNDQNQNNRQSQEYKQQDMSNKNISDARQSQQAATQNGRQQEENNDSILLRKMQESKYEELQQKVEMMEKQLILDREQFSKMENELILNRHEMMQTLINTKEQLNNVLKSREESKAREMQYQQQLKQHQLQQLQQVTLKHQQDETENHGVEEVYENEDSSDSDYYPPPPLLPKSQPLLDDQHENSFRRMARSKSQEYIKQQYSRSSSASIQNTQYYSHYPDEERRSVSRRNSSTSNRSNKLDPSPSNTLVANSFPQQRRINTRLRARSIEAGRWHEEQQPIIYDETDMQPYQNRPRRSRSVGRRPRSRGSMVFYEDIQNDDVYYNSPRYQQDPYSDGYYMQPQYYYNQYHSQQAPSFRQALPRYPFNNNARHYGSYHHQQ